MNSSGTFMIERFKLRQSPSIILAMELMKAASSTLRWPLIPPTVALPLSEFRLWNYVFVAGKRTFTSYISLTDSNNEANPPNNIQYITRDPQ